MTTNEPNPAPDQPPVEKSGLRRTAGAVGTSLGCLLFLIGFIIAVAGVVAIFLDDPTFALAGVALLVALAALKASKRK